VRVLSVRRDLGLEFETESALLAGIPVPKLVVIDSGAGEEASDSDSGAGVERKEDNADKASLSTSRYVQDHLAFLSR